MKAKGIPLWVTILGCLLAAVGIVFGVIGLVDPTAAPAIDDANDVVGRQWAGRSTALGVVMALAVWMRHATAYLAAFAGAALREFGDLLAGIDDSDTRIIIVAAVFLSLEVAAITFIWPGAGAARMASGSTTGVKTDS